MNFCQMTGKDKDYRYMATSDLLNELNKEGFKADADLEIKLTNTVLQQLEDAAGDVSGLAVKWSASAEPYSIFVLDFFFSFFSFLIFCLIVHLVTSWSLNTFYRTFSSLYFVLNYIIYYCLSMTN